VPSALPVHVTMAVFPRCVELPESPVIVATGLVDHLLHDRGDAAHEAVHVKANLCHLAVLIGRFVLVVGQDRGHVGDVIRISHLGGAAQGLLRLLRQLR